MRTSVLAVTVTLLASCELPGEPSPAAEEMLAAGQQAIIGGSPDPNDPAVVLMQTPGGGCTGTLVSPRVILTAAHCVSDAIESGQSNQGNVSFGPGGSEGFEASRRVQDMVMYRLYDPPAFLQYDIAMMRLEQPAPVDIAPIPINFEPLDDNYLGLVVKTVGFGVTDGAAQTGFGTKRQVALTIDDVSYFHLGLGDGDFNICQGDSGGPTFAEFAGEERVIGVSSFGSDECNAPSSITRADIYEDWLNLVMDSWDGPCQADAVCVTEGCRTPDPDCDVCGFDGICGGDCPSPDLDCPLGARLGDACGSDVDCESRRCITASDDERLTYCSEACDPASALEACSPPLSVCTERDGEFLCEYNGATPGAQGAACDDGSDCRSSTCDLDERMCVEPCGDGLPACAAEFECRDLGDGQFCRAPEGEGGCGCSTRGDAGGYAALGLAIALLSRRRRR